MATVSEAGEPPERSDNLTHWPLVQAMRNQFCDKWSRDYLNTLQKRNKRIIRRSNIRVRELIVVLDPSLLQPDGKWPLGRVVAVHCGGDGLVRIAMI